MASWKNSSGVPHRIHSHPSFEPPHFLEHIPAKGKKAKLQRKCVMCTKHGKRRESV
jgi:hypothetical protein